MEIGGDYDLDDGGQCAARILCPRRFMSYEPPPTFSLEPIPRCPDRRCRRPRPDINLGIGSELSVRCENKKCRTHWWASRLRAGSVEEQLMRDFDDRATVEQLVAKFRIYRLPLVIAEPLYWQVWLTGPEAHEYNRAKDERRALELIRRVLHLHRRAG